MTPTPHPETMPPYQLERRQTIIRAARELIDEKDIDLVQMREVAARAGVALGTLYRYFGSKDYLYAVVLGEWGRPREEEWFSSLPPADRFRARIHQWFGALARNPAYYKIVRMLVDSKDPAALAESKDIGAQLSRSLVEDLAQLEPTDAAHIAEIVWALQNELLARVRTGHFDVAECLRILDTFADLVRMKLDSLAT